MLHDWQARLTGKISLAAVAAFGSLLADGVLTFALVSGRHHAGMVAPPGGDGHHLRLARSSARGYSCIELALDRYVLQS